MLEWQFRKLHYTLDLPYEVSKSKRFNRFWIIHGESKLISKLFKLMKTTFIPRWAALEAVEHK